MAVNMVLNELSLGQKAADVRSAQIMMVGLVQTIRTAVAGGVSRGLRTSADIHAVEIAPGYRVARWQNDGEVERESRTYFLSAVTKVFELIDPNDATREIPALFEFKFRGASANGLGAAFMADGLALSLSSSEEWNTNSVEIEYSRLGEDEQFTRSTENVHHASTVQHVGENAAWIEERIRLGVRDGGDMWTRRNELFPSLDFCDSVRSQVEQLKGGDPHLKQVRDRLFELQTYCDSWREGPFDINGVATKITPESRATLDAYGAERTFMCPDGRNHTFSLHARLTPGAWRLFLSPQAGERRIVIGYVGQKLRTVSSN